MDRHLTTPAYKLHPGEGLVGKVASAFSPSAGTDISYAKIDSLKKVTIGATAFASGDFILAYNPSYVVSETPVVTTTDSFATLAEIRQLPASRNIGQIWQGHRFRVDWIRPPRREGK